jgi:hypothetical protein
MLFVSARWKFTENLNTARNPRKEKKLYAENSEAPVRKDTKL